MLPEERRKRIINLACIIWPVELVVIIITGIFVFLILVLFSIITVILLILLGTVTFTLTWSVGMATYITVMASMAIIAIVFYIKMVNKEYYSIVNNRNYLTIMIKKLLTGGNFYTIWKSYQFLYTMDRLEY